MRKAAARRHERATHNVATRWTQKQQQRKDTNKKHREERSAGANRTTSVGTARRPRCAGVGNDGSTRDIGDMGDYMETEFSATRRSIDDFFEKESKMRGRRSPQEIREHNSEWERVKDSLVTLHEEVQLAHPSHNYSVPRNG